MAGYRNVLVLLLMLAVCSFHGSFAHAQGGVYTFTDAIDGFVWPRAQFSSQAPGGGLAGDQFDTPDGIGFSNFTGNPAFFDNNNFLTRPSTLLSLDAWWLSPRNTTALDSNGDPFTSNTITMFALNAVEPVVAVGFDAAMASVSQAVPASLSIQIHDTLGNVVLGTLDFDPANIGQPDNNTVVAGTFQTLNSPHPGREGRFFATVDDIFDVADIAANDPNYDEATYGFELIDINLTPLHTLGGTSEFAVDHLVFNSGQVPQQVILLSYFEADETVPSNLVYIFTYTDASPSQDHETTIDPAQFNLSDDLQDIAVITSGAALDATELLNAESVTVDIIFDADQAGLDIHSHELIHQVQSGGEHEGITHVTDVNVKANPPGGQAPLAFITANTSLDPYAIQQHTELGPELFEEGAAFASLVDQQGPNAFDDPTGLLGAFLSLFQVDGGTQTLDELLAEQATDSGLFFLGISLSEYIAQQSEGLDPGDPVELIPGDSGATISEVLDDQGNIQTYQVTTWIIVDQNGTAQQVHLQVPEPGSLALLVVGGAMLLSRPRGRVCV